MKEAKHSRSRAMFPRGNYARASPSSVVFSKGNPKPTRVGKIIGCGELASCQGVWGMCPLENKRGQEPNHRLRQRVGPKTKANPQPTGVSKNEDARGCPC